VLKNASVPCIFSSIYIMEYETEYGTIKESDLPRVVQEPWSSRAPRFFLFYAVMFVCVLVIIWGLIFVKNHIMDNRSKCVDTFTGGQLFTDVPSPVQIKSVYIKTTGINPAHIDVSTEAVSYKVKLHEIDSIAGETTYIYHLPVQVLARSITVYNPRKTKSPIRIVIFDADTNLVWKKNVVLSDSEICDIPLTSRLAGSTLSYI
jgi:hypothetical protein